MRIIIDTDYTKDIRICQEAFLLFVDFLYAACIIHGADSGEKPANNS